MYNTELKMRQEADTAREQIRIERRKEARREINIYLERGMERTIAVNSVLGTGKISIIDRKEVRKFFNYGCHTICSMNQTLLDIKNQNSSDLILEAI